MAIGRWQPEAERWWPAGFLPPKGGNSYRRWSAKVKAPSNSTTKFFTETENNKQQINTTQATHAHKVENIFSKHQVDNNSDTEHSTKLIQKHIEHLTNKINHLNESTEKIGITLVNHAHMMESISSNLKHTIGTEQTEKLLQYHDHLTHKSKDTEQISTTLDTAIKSMSSQAEKVQKHIEHLTNKINYLNENTEKIGIMMESISSNLKHTIGTEQAEKLLKHHEYLTHKSKNTEQISITLDTAINGSKRLGELDSMSSQAEKVDVMACDIQALTMQITGVHEKLDTLAKEANYCSDVLEQLDPNKLRDSHLENYDDDDEDLLDHLEIPTGPPAPDVAV